MDTNALFINHALWNGGDLYEVTVNAVVVCGQKQKTRMCSPSASGLIRSLLGQNAVPALAVPPPDEAVLRLDETRPTVSPPRRAREQPADRQILHRHDLRPVGGRGAHVAPVDEDGGRLARGLARWRDVFRNGFP